MKKSIFFVLIALLIIACSPRKKQSQNVGLKGFTSYYNTLFNSKEALETEENNRIKSHKDNFYAKYIRLLKTDEQLLGNDFDSNSMFSEAEGIGSVAGPNMQNGKGATTLQIAESKALKAISKYSVIKKGEEKNKRMFDAHLLLAQSRLYMDKPLEALDALNYIFANMRKDKDINLAKIYQGLAFSKMQDYYRANETFLELKNSDLKKNEKKLLSIYYSEMLLESGKKEEAIAELEEAFEYNKNRELRSRIAFLRGQILADLGKNEDARESFTSAYKYSNNFEFETKSQVEIAKTFNATSDDYEGAKKYLESISKKGTYASRKNEFYYALGLMANKAGKSDEAQEFFRKALDEKVSDPQIRGLTFFEVGKSYFDKNDYISAGAYYDSALAVMNYEPSKKELALLSKNIKDVTKNFYLVKKNDSILALVKMSEPERIAYFGSYIEKLKAKEQSEELQRKKDERQKGFDTGDYNTNSIFATTSGKSGFQDFSDSGSKGGFYFANDNTVSKGQAEFKQIWGGRSLVDNWRFSNRTTSIDDVKSLAMGTQSAQDPMRFEPSFYIDKIPTNQDELSALKKDRDTASLGLGRMYNQFFSNRPLATKTLYDLVDNKPEEDVKLQALYQIFAMNYEDNPSAAERAKIMILTDFPYTSYAEFVKNPKSANFLKSSPEVEKAYKDAFALYSEEKYAESQSLISQSLEKYPKDALVPKFSLLNAFNTGKVAGKEIMILQLEQIALNYGKTLEGEKAKEMLKFLKSELEMEMTDSQGNSLKKEEKPKPPIRKIVGQIEQDPPQQGVGSPTDPDPNQELSPDEIDALLKEQDAKLREIDKKNAEKKTK